MQYNATNLWLSNYFHVAKIPGRFLIFAVNLCVKIVFVNLIKVLSCWFQVLNKQKLFGSSKFQLICDDIRKISSHSHLSGEKKKKNFLIRLTWHCFYCLHRFYGLFSMWHHCCCLRLHYLKAMAKMKRIKVSPKMT